MAKKRSCQNVREPRPLNAVEMGLYGCVEEAVFTQPSVIPGDSLPELRCNMRLTVDLASQADYVHEAAGPSNRLPFRASVDDTHFLWVYHELFTRLGVRLPFTDFQREVMTRCRVAASQLHLNGWGFMRTFEHVLPFPGKRPFWLDDEGNPFPWVYSRNHCNLPLGLTFLLIILLLVRFAFGAAYPLSYSSIIIPMPAPTGILPELSIL
ncbi:hypothetical protein PIB30_065608 [Stylosanthes scabra]|uniref:Uncharacterized protein n=1 Tax=Stylosanthes scabra TaxID=79078 RepID=A0ABU6SN17_9FABA|nr:hypothetical protein [Stylosanthes scabra]